jgi:GrpB-like predicted nucleotidyltransferase (UPF0157 family)
MTTPVVIEDYDPQWPQRFAVLRARIAAVLGALAAAIDHIGSTAVAGLAAKPVIDVDVLLRSADDLSAVIDALATLGYKHQGDLGVPGREAFRAPLSEFPHHLYVCPPESQEYRRHLAFRDYLRSNPEDARAYADLKRRLAAELGADRDAYTRAKTQFVQEILRRTGQNSVDPDHGTFFPTRRTIT